MWRIELMDWLCFIGSIGVVVVIVGALFGIGLAMFGSGVALMGSGEKAKGGEINVREILYSAGNHYVGRRNSCRRCLRRRCLRHGLVGD